MSKPPARIPMTEDEKLAVQLLSGCRFVPGSWDKRYVRFISETTAHIPAISEKEAAQLWRLLYKYRRQWSHPEKTRLLDMATKLAAPDFRKQRSAMEAQRKIDALKAKYRQALNAPTEQAKQEELPRVKRVFDLE